MTKKLRKAIRERIVCLDNGHVSHYFALAGDTYGRLMGMTPGGEFAEFNSWEDSTFDQVKSVVYSLIPLSQGGDEALRQVLGLACDPSPAGYVYSFTGEIWCPVCSSANVKYGPDDPPVIETVEVPQVTHERWNRLSDEEKRELIREGLREKGWLDKSRL